LGTTEAGAVEYDGTHLYFTAVNAGARYQLDQTPWDIIGDPTGNGSIAFGSTVQTMDWATATTTNPLSMTASALTTGKLLSLSSNTLTSGTLLDISSNGTGGLTNQKGLNVSLSGTNGTALQTTYGVYISNAHAGTTSTNIGIYATATGGTTTNWAGQFVVAGATSIVARFTNGTGSCDINPTTTALVCASDINLKKNIVTMDDKEFALQTVPDITSMSIKDKLMLLTPVKYNWKSEQDTDGKHAGFIAQEIEQIFPDLVFTDPTTGLKSVAFTNLIPYTIEAFKEMNLKITELNNMDKKNDWRDSLSAWFGNASNKITRIFTGEICLSDENGETECINRSQLKSLKNLINISNTASVLPPVDNTINTPVPEITVPITEPTVTQAPIEVPIMEPSVTEVSTPTTNTTPVL